MKSILSPYDDINFNEFLLKYIKKSLKKKCLVFTRDDEERKYFLDEDSKDYYTPDDIIKSLKLNGRVIYFSNKELINYVVYDLSQRFWYDTMRDINNIIRKLYLEYKRSDESIQQRKLSHEKHAQQRMQETRR